MTQKSAAKKLPYIYGTFSLATNCQDVDFFDKGSVKFRFQGKINAEIYRMIAHDVRNIATHSELL